MFSFSFPSICNSNIDYCISLQPRFKYSTNVLKLLSRIISINKELLDIYNFFNNSGYINSIVTDYFLDNDLIYFSKYNKSPSIKFSEFDELKRYLLDLYTVSDETLKKLHSILEYNT